MICYRCNQEAGREDICPFCGTNLSIFNKIIRLSNTYYNDGLQKAEVRNLSGAIISLKKSLKFNKYNIEARNLLGLVYYEMGEVVDALSEWVISKSYQQDDNIAGRYLEKLKQNPGQLNAINQTIKKYNQALLYCKQDSRDLAIMQLKKVLSMNPRLVKAHQLLALLYLQEEKLELAKKSLRSAGKIDANNTITLRYLKEVNSKMKAKGGSKKKKEDDLISYQSGNETIIMPTRFQDYSLGATMAYLLIGLVVGALVIGFLVVPGIRSNLQQEMKNQLIEANETIATNTEVIANLESQVAELSAKVAEYEALGDSLPEQTASYEALLSAYAAYVGNDHLTAGANLEAVDVEQLTENARTIYDTMWAAVAENYFAKLYANGYDHYTAGRYAEAITSLLSVVNQNKDYKNGNAAYYLAQAYNRSGDMESARPLYQYIIDNYPNTEKARTARNYLNTQ